MIKFRFHIYRLCTTLIQILINNAVVIMIVIHFSIKYITASKYAWRKKFNYNKQDKKIATTDAENKFKKKLCLENN